MLSSNDTAEITRLIRDAAERAFCALHDAFPNDRFYYHALITTSVAHRPGPSASSHEGLAEILERYQQEDPTCSASDLRWSEADSPHNLFGDEYFASVEERFLRQFPDPYELSDDTIEQLFCCMATALRQLDQEGFFSQRGPRQSVMINVVAPGDEDERRLFERATTLNPPEALAQLKADWKIE